MVGDDITCVNEGSVSRDSAGVAVVDVLDVPSVTGVVGVTVTVDLIVYVMGIAPAVGVVLCAQSGSRLKTARNPSHD